MTLNRAQAPDQTRVLVDVADDDTATVLPRSTVDLDPATAASEGRMVIDATAAPHDGDAYALTKDPPPPGRKTD